MDNTNNPVCFTLEIWVPELRGNATLSVHESDVMEYTGQRYADLDNDEKEEVKRAFKYRR